LPRSCKGLNKQPNGSKGKLKIIRWKLSLITSLFKSPF